MSPRVLTARRWVRPLVWCLLLAPGLSAWYLLRTYPAWLHHRVEAALSERLGRESSIAEFRLDPISLVAEVRGLRVPGPLEGPPLLEVGRMELHLAREGLIHGPLRVLRAEVENPALTLTRRADGSWEGEEVLERLWGGEGPSDPIALEALRIVGGEVRIRDSASGRSAHLEHCDLWLPALSSLPGEEEKPARFRFACRVLGGQLRAAGVATPWAETPGCGLELRADGLGAESIAEAFGLPLPEGLARATFGGSARATVTAPKSLPSKVEFGGDLDAASGWRGAGAPAEVHLRAEGLWQPSTGSMDARLQGTLRGLDLPAATASFPGLLGTLRPRGGTADARCEIRCSLRPEVEPEITLAGTAHLDGLVVSEGAGGPFLWVPGAEVRLGRCEPLAGRYLVESLRLEGPRLRVEGDPAAQGERILRAAGRDDSTAWARPSIALGPVRIGGGRVDFEGAGPEGPLPQSLRDVTLSLLPPPLDRGPWRIDGEARTSDGARLAARGYLPGEGRPAELDVTVHGLSPDRIGSLLPPELAAHLEGAEVDAGGRVRWEPDAKGSGLSITEGALEVRSLRVRSLSGSEFLDFPEILVTGVAVDLDRRLATCDEVRAAEGRLRLQRDAEGALNLPHFQSPAHAEGGTPWSLSARRALFPGWEARFEDWSLREPVSVEVSQADLELEDLSTDSEAEAKLRLEVVFEEGGRVSLAGIVRTGPPSVESRLTLRDVPLALLQPYVAERLEVVVQDGLLTCDGALATMTPDQGPPGPPSFRGDLLVSGFRAVEPERWEDLLTWDTLHLGGVVLSSSPPSARVREAALSDFYARAQIRPDATFNLFHLWRPVALGSAEAAPAAAPGAGFRLDAAVLQNGTVDFSDRFIQPNYSASLRGVTGRLSGFDSSGGTAAEIELRGRLGEGAPFEVVGLANPFRKDLFADIRASCRNVDLVPFSSYAGKYAGYSIAGGKMHLEVTYRMEDRRMEATSRVFLDQLALGDKVSGSGAPDLPLRLAVALLKDRSGQIMVEVPLTGSMDELQVDLKPLVGKMFRGALAKALTSPFRWMARVFRREPEVLLVGFEPGRSELGSGAGETLARAAEKLGRARSAKISVAGLFEPRSDEEGLKREILRKRVASERTAEERRVSGDGGGTLSPEKYAHLLATIYGRERFPKPKDEGGRTKELPVPEMEKLLLAYTEVGLGDLRRLADERAQAVRGALVALGAPSERIYVVDPDALPPAAREGLRTRAALAIR